MKRQRLNSVGAMTVATMKMTKTPDKPVPSSATQALAFATAQVATGATWRELQNALFGIGGRIEELFPSETDRRNFATTEEYRQISELLLQAWPTNPPPADVSGKLLVRLPKSLHAALQAEAEAEGTSLNQLIVAKLAAPLSSLTTTRTR